LTKAGAAAAGLERNAVRTALARRASLKDAITGKGVFEWKGAAQPGKNHLEMPVCFFNSLAMGG
jgi:hypothetical protein